MVPTDYKRKDSKTWNMGRHNAVLFPNVRVLYVSLGQPQDSIAGASSLIPSLMGSSKRPCDVCWGPFSDHPIQMKVGPKSEPVPNSFGGPGLQRIYG